SFSFCNRLSGIKTGKATFECPVSLICLSNSPLIFSQIAKPYGLIIIVPRTNPYSTSSASFTTSVYHWAKSSSIAVIFSTNCLSLLMISTSYHFIIENTEFVIRSERTALFPFMQEEVSIMSKIMCKYVASEMYFSFLPALLSLLRLRRAESYRGFFSGRSLLTFPTFHFSFTHYNGCNRSILLLYQKLHKNILLPVRDRGYGGTTLVYM